MRLVAIALLVILFSPSQQQNQKTAPTNTSTNTDKRGTNEAPLVVKTLPPVKAQAEIEQETKDRKDKSANDRNIVKLSAVLALVAALQLFVYSYQAYKLRETVKSAGEQAEAMERHIGEAARAATAMEKIATTIDGGNRAVMRAYVTVTVGTAIYQERRGPGQSDLYFEARPNLLNTGGTPARRVRIKTKADILPIPIPEDFTYPLPDDPVKPSFGAVVGAHQTHIMFGSVERFVPDAEVASIKQGTDKALCVWGVVTYEDIFGVPHSTKFGQIITWLPNNNIFIYFITGQNDAD
ncbi:MAG TPA: hypothetical protein VH088_11465 [Terriglobales bacterium]|nr:hypothetical protein [Terriglobales bacterium]